MSAAHAVPPVCLDGKEAHSSTFPDSLSIASLTPQGQPEPLDARQEPRLVGLDAVDQGCELSAGEAREAFGRLFVRLLKQKGLIHGR